MTFDLQMFAEEGVVETTAPSSVTEPTEPTGGEQPKSSDGFLYNYSRDKAGRNVLTITREETESQAEPPKAEPPKETETKTVEDPSPVSIPPITAGNEPRAEPYTVADIATAVQAGIPLSTERIPAEFVGWYQQQLAEKQKQTVPDVKAQQKEFFQKVAAKAKQEALEELKMTERDLTVDIETLDFEEQEALTQKRRAYQELVQTNHAALMSQVQLDMVRYAQDRERQASVLRGIAEYTDNLRKTEPYFDAINQKMLTFYQTFPWQEGVVVKDAIDALKNGTVQQHHAEVLRQYWDKTRLSHYAEIKNLSTKPDPIVPPPTTEKPNGGAVQTAEAPDWNNLRNMNTREQRNYIMKFFK